MALRFLALLGAALASSATAAAQICPETLQDHLIEAVWFEQNGREYRPVPLSATDAVVFTPGRIGESLPKLRVRLEQALPVGCEVVLDLRPSGMTATHSTLATDFTALFESERAPSLLGNGTQNADVQIPLVQSSQSRRTIVAELYHRNGTAPHRLQFDISPPLLSQVVDVTPTLTSLPELRFEVRLPYAVHSDVPLSFDVTGGGAVEIIPLSYRPTVGDIHPMRVVAGLVPARSVFALRLKSGELRAQGEVEIRGPGEGTFRLPYDLRSTVLTAVSSGETTPTSPQTTPAQTADCLYSIKPLPGRLGATRFIDVMVDNLGKKACPSSFISVVLKTQEGCLVKPVVLKGPKEVPPLPRPVFGMTSETKLASMQATQSWTGRYPVENTLIYDKMQVSITLTSGKGEPLADYKASLNAAAFK